MRCGRGGSVRLYICIEQTPVQPNAESTNQGRPAQWITLPDAAKRQCECCQRGEKADVPQDDSFSLVIVFFVYFSDINKGRCLWSSRWQAWYWPRRSWQEKLCWRSPPNSNGSALRGWRLQCWSDIGPDRCPRLTSERDGASPVSTINVQNGHRLYISGKILEASTVPLPRVDPAGPIRD